MTDKRLRKLRKTELLWIIRDQEAEIIELKELLKEHGIALPENVGDGTDNEDKETSYENNTNNHGQLP